MPTITYLALSHPDLMTVPGHIDIRASTSRVWAYLTDLQVVAIVVPHVEAAWWVTRGLPGVGSVGSGMTTAAGMRLRGSARITAWDVEHLLVARAISGMIAEVAVELRSLGDHTRVRVEARFVPPGPLALFRRATRTRAHIVVGEALENLRAEIMNREYTRHATGTACGSG